ncbi:MAG: YjbH domain-containing protein [Ignavibacteria bacterium]|nr:YjbH domain-containing protein [Ignavibacteria bacterium]
MNNNSLGLILILFFSFYSSVLSQFEYESRIIKLISDAGFENVRVKSVEEKLFIEFENRLYRFEVTALYELFKLIKNELSDFNSLVFSIKNKNIPIVEVRVNRIDLVDWLENRITNSEFSELMDIRFNSSNEVKQVFNSSEISNSSNLKFDLVLKPTYRFQFGIFSKPVLYQFNFTPHIEFGLWKGMSGLYEITIPLHNDFSPREDSVRTSMAVLNQTLKLSDSHLLSTSIGYFSLDRYGIDLDSRWYFMNGDLSLGLNIGYTGYASFTMKKIYYSDLYLWTGSADLSYRISDYDLTIGISAGKYLSKDNTFRFDIYRDFGEIQIGFFAMRSTKGISNGGFSFSIPLPPTKHLKPGLVRIRTTDNLAYTYKVKIADLIGLQYETGFRTNNFIEKLYPGFINNFINYRIN